MRGGLNPEVGRLEGRCLRFSGIACQLCPHPRVWHRRGRLGVRGPRGGQPRAAVFLWLLCPAGRVGSTSLVSISGCAFTWSQVCVLTARTSFRLVTWRGRRASRAGRLQRGPHSLGKFITAFGASVPCRVTLSHATFLPTVLLSEIHFGDTGILLFKYLYAAVSRVHSQQRFGPGKCKLFALFIEQ